MTDSMELEQILTLALRLSPGERLRLVERVVASVEREITIAPEEASDEHWGKKVVALLETLDLSDWEADEFADAAAWVKRQREEIENAHRDDWDKPL